MELKQDDSGFWYYPDKPEEFRVASVFDFKSIIPGTPFLIHSFHYDVFQCYRTNKNFKIDHIIKWINHGRVYVKK